MSKRLRANRLSHLAYGQTFPSDRTAHVNPPTVKRPSATVTGHQRSTSARLDYTRQTLKRLIEARQAARNAGLTFTLPRIQLAISSARGAVRNAEGRMHRTNERNSAKWRSL